MALTAENQKALDDLGKMWNSAKTPEEKNNIHTWANAIRNAGGMQAGRDYDPTTGASSTPASSGGGTSGTPSGFQFTPSVTPAAQQLGQATTTPYGDQNRVGSNQAPAPAYDGGGGGGGGGGPTGGGFGGGGSQSQQIMDYIKSLTMQNGQQTQTMQAQLQAHAQAQAQTIAKQKQQALNNLINSLKTQQGQALKGILNGTQDAKMGLEDSSFQQYLAARQGMANRGLSGSGIASDQDTRLLLAKQRDLSGIYRDAGLQTDKVNSGINQQLDQAYQGLSNINTGEIASGIFSDLYGKGQKSMLDQATLYSDLFKTTLPYDQAQVKDLLDFGNKQNQINLDTLKAQDGSLIAWAKVGQDDKKIIQENAKILIEGGKLDLDKWKTFGYMPDPGGSGKLVPTAATTQANRTAALEEAKARGYFIGPNGEIIPTEQNRSNQATETLRGNELTAQVTNWAAQNTLAGGRLNLSEAEFKHKMDYDQATIDRLGAEFTLNKDKVQLNGLKSQLSSVDSEIRATIAQGMEVSPNMSNQRNQLMSQISSLFQSAPKNTNSSGISPDIFKGWSNISTPNSGVNPQFKTWIDQGGATAGVKSDVIYKMMLAESDGNPNVGTSSAGAQGLMQFMPDTAKAYGVDVRDPKSSINGSIKYMKDLLNMFGNDYSKAVAAYNWGEGNVQRAVQKYGMNWKDALPGETKGYLKKVLGG